MGNAGCCGVWDLLMEALKRLCPPASEVLSSHLSHRAQLETPPYFRQKQINGMSLSPPLWPQLLELGWGGGGQGWGSKRIP